MIDNPMINYPQDRMSYLQSMDVQAYYAERRRRVDKPNPRPCIQPVHRSGEARFDVRA